MNGYKNCQLVFRDYSYFWFDRHSTRASGQGSGFGCSCGPSTYLPCLPRLATFACLMPLSSTIQAEALCNLSIPLSLHYCRDCLGYPDGSPLAAPNNVGQYSVPGVSSH